MDALSRSDQATLAFHDAPNQDRQTTSRTCIAGLRTAVPGRAGHSGSHAAYSRPDSHVADSLRTRSRLVSLNDVGRRPKKGRMKCMRPSFNPMDSPSA